MFEIEIYKIDNKHKVTFNQVSDDHYKVEIYCYNRQIYGKTLNDKFYKIYKNYIIERLKVIVEYDLLTEEFDIVEIGNRLFKVVDSPYTHYKELIRTVQPLDYDSDPITVDFILDCSMNDIITYPKDSLIYKFGNFYGDNKLLCSLKELIDNEVISSDIGLDSNVPIEVLNYISSKYYFRDFKYYISDTRKVELEKWYR